MKEALVNVRLQKSVPVATEFYAAVHLPSQTVHRKNGFATPVLLGIMISVVEPLIAVMVVHGQQI